MFEKVTSEDRWKKVTLGEVAINSTVATQSPEEDGFERYIIGKHIPGDGSSITNWNEVGDGEFGSRIRTIVRKGDVVCTTRGPKLRVAVATFDCLSAHTNFILRTQNSRTFLQEYLQAITCSADFQNHLRRNFRGSTNLFVNWSDAAKFTFSLPPVQEQARVAEALNATANNLTALRALADCTEDLLYSHILETLALKSFAQSEGYRGPYEIALGEETYTPTSGNGEPVFSDDGDTLFFKVADFNRNADHRSLSIADARFDSGKNPAIRVFHPGTVIFPKRGASIFLNKIGILSREAALDPNLMALEPKKDKVSAEFLMWFFKGVGLSRYADTTSVPQLNHKHLKPVPIPLPSSSEQRVFTNHISKIADAVADIRQRITQAEAAHTRVREQAIKAARVEIDI